MAKQLKLTERGVNSKVASKLKKDMQDDYQKILKAEISKQKATGKLTPKKFGNAGKSAGAIYRKKYGFSKTETGTKRWGKIMKLANKKK